MFNLNIPTTPSLLGVDSGGGICTTPKTPEILNSLIAMTNPLDNYTFAISPTSTTTTPTATGAAQTITQSINNHQIISQDSSHSSSSGSPLDSPAGTNTTPSVQQTCSQLIKAGLKLSIQSKRKMSSGDSSSGNEQPMSKCARQSTAGDDTSDDDDTESHKSPRTGLTPEDEDRRRRRRERNKIAATKCRMKKRERTLNLVSESEQLETQNVELKSQVKNLETERRKLFDMLQSHSPSCIRPGGYNPPPNLCQSPACKYLNDIGMCDQQNGVSNNNNNDQQDHTHHQRTTIPSMNTIKYSRNGLRHNNNHNNTNNSNNNNNNNNNSNTNNNSSNNNSQIITTTSDLQLPNGYCKPSPTTHEIGYLNSPTQDVVIGSCLHSQLTNGHHNHQQQQQQHQQQQQQQQQQQHLQNHHQNHHQHQQQQHDHQQQHLQTTIIKTDYIPNCENSNGGTTVDSTTDFVLKSELVDAQSPYTTVQSADRFLFEADCENFDIKCNGNSNNNNNNNLNTNNNNTMDFHPQIATTPTTCQSYDSLLIKNDFLTDNSELLAQLTDGTDSEFTDLDSGVTAYAHITNGGCLA